MSLVTPGVPPVLAIFLAASVFRREDLPTFALPTKQTSGRAICFLWPISVTLLVKLASIMRMKHPFLPESGKDSRIRAGS